MGNLLVPLRGLLDRRLGGQTQGEGSARVGITPSGRETGSKAWFWSDHE